jgi:transcriptional regulator with XRE-family HTH domain
MFVKPNNLRALRLQRGKSLAELAVSGKFGTATLTMIERYGHEPRPETKERIAKALGVDVGNIWPTGNQSDPQTAA